MAFDLGGYNEVPERIREFRDKYPEGSFQPFDPSNPYRIERIGDQAFVVYVAAAYRDPWDRRPGIGCAWEPFPGKTTYTHDSELQNAETSAWGRAIVAALAADAKKVATAHDARAREPEKRIANTIRKALAARLERLTEEQAAFARPLWKDAQLPPVTHLSDMPASRLEVAVAILDEAEAISDESDAPNQTPDPVEEIF